MRPSSHSKLALPLLSVLVCMASCVTILDGDKDYRLGASSASGAGGTGGAGAAGATGGTAAAGAGGAGGAAQECMTPADCGQAPTCQEATCDNGMCGTANAASGTVCVDGGQVCDGSGACVECVTNAECDPLVCDQGVCVSLMCTDNMQNGTETDVDCGGDCAPCGNGSPCLVGGDCATGFCPNDGICCDAACGGACRSCTGAETGGQDGTCAFVLANTDPSMECTAPMVCDGAGTCALKPLGASCLMPTECASTRCVDGVCCDGVCNGGCNGCNMMLTGGADGLCLNIPAYADPEMECGPGEACGGSGSCKALDGQPCQSNSNCVSQNCVMDICEP